MTLKKYITGDKPLASESMGNHNESFVQAGLNAVRIAIDRTMVYSNGEIDGWCEAYIDETGRDNSVDVAETTALFNTDAYLTATATDPYVIIEASTVTASDFDVNNCKIHNVSSGKWQVSCDTGSIEVKRAQIYKTLFYGTDGSNPRITDSIASITALKTSVDRDVGKRGHYITYSASGAGVSTTLTGTFSDTTNNTDCSSWSRCHAVDPGAGDATTNWEIPEGTEVNVATNTTSDEIGTDTSGDEAGNPADCQVTISDTSGDPLVTANARVVILSKGAINWVDSGGYPTTSYTDTDFTDDESIPVMTTATEDFASIIDHDLPTGTFSSTISAAIGVPMIDNWEADANIQFKLLNASDDSGWLDCMNSEPTISNFTAFSSEPTRLLVKLIPKGTSPTNNYPSIKGFWVRAK